MKRELPWRSTEDQAVGLDRVARLAMQHQVNLELLEVDDGIWGLVPVGVPPAEALQVLYVTGEYDVWAKGGREFEAAQLNAEDAAARLVKQYKEYKLQRIIDRGT